MDEPTGTIVFTTFARPHYGFDLFSLKLPSDFQVPITETNAEEHRLTDGISINFNGQFIDDDESLVYISERSGSSQIYLNRTGISKPEQLVSAPGSLFHDRPIIKNQRLYFVSAHEEPEKPWNSWCAVYSAGLVEEKIVRLTPYGTVDYSPAISLSGKFIAVASYGSRPWGGEFHDLQTDIVVFRESDPSIRTVVADHGSWPTWSGDSTIYFHRQSDDGWWSIFRVDLLEIFELSPKANAPVRITPPGVHAFTPAAMPDGKRIAVATRRKGKQFRHIEIYDLESKKFCSVTESLNPNFHHYNPFVSPESGTLGYHRFRGVSAPGDSTIPHLEPLMSPAKELRIRRLNGFFPMFSPDGDLIAFNHDFGGPKSGLKIVKSDGSKRWTVIKGRTAFGNAWSPTEKNVIYTSIGPIFESVKAAVQIARISFDPSTLDGREEITADIKILTDENTGNNAFPSCSPDGKSIVFRSGRSGHKNLYIIDAVNGEISGGIRQLTEGPWIDTMPSWSPDGKLIAFSSNRHNPDDKEAFSVYVIKLDGTDLQRVYVGGSRESSDVDRERINHVIFSKDSRWLLLTANLGGVTAEPISWPNQFQPYGDLYLVRLDGSGLRRLTWNSYENGTPTWHSGGEVDMGKLCLGNEIGDKLTGEFVDPKWISCDI